MTGTGEIPRIFHTRLETTRVLLKIPDFGLVWLAITTCAIRRAPQINLMDGEAEIAAVKPQTGFGILAPGEIG